MTDTGITNTTRTVIDRVRALGDPDAIVASEARGQHELVHSDRLPTDTGHGYIPAGDAPYLALGFTFGPADPQDPLFRPATLPDGWTREGSDHDMWSYLLDPRGIRRVAVFYKAAFYDRRAFMRIEREPGGAAAYRHAYDGSALPWDAFTDDERAQAVAALRELAATVDDYSDATQVGRARAELARIGEQP